MNIMSIYALKTRMKQAPNQAVRKVSTAKPVKGLSGQNYLELAPFVRVGGTKCLTARDVAYICRGNKLGRATRARFLGRSGCAARCRPQRL